MARRKKGNPVNGWINLYKPAGVVSTHAVSIIKRAFNAQKVGHAGTLDPLADGILPIALGEATKTVPYVQDALKIYEFDAIWGAQRTTDDAEGDIVQTTEHRPKEADIRDCLSQFTGHIKQIPPIYSAIKIDGQRAYDLARYGTNPESIEMPEREVYIERLECLDVQEDYARFECLCGKGTYIRSLVRDIALKCDSLAYVGMLKRKQVGPFDINDAVSLDIFEQSTSAENMNEYLLPVSYVLSDLPCLQVSNDEAALLKRGQFLNLISRLDSERLSDIGLSPSSSAPIIALARHNQKDIGLIQIKGIQIKPERLFNLG